jgi:CBS domain-containing protein
MDRHIVTVESSSTVYDAHSLMEQTNRWAIPVVEDGVYRGLFTSDRLMHVYRLVGNQTSYRRRALQIWTALNVRVRGTQDAS